MKYTNNLFLLLLFICQLSFTGCDQHGDPQANIPLTDQQKATVSMRGVWGQASEVSLPEGTTEGVLDDLVVEFRITDEYTPGGFTASGADYFFLTDNGLWSWEGESTSDIMLTNVSPVSHILVVEEAASIRVTFLYEGSENGRLSGIGEYGVTLRKIAP